MIGVTYQVVPVDGPAWSFRSTLVHEMAWERYAVRHKLPINPTVRDGQADLATFPMAANGALLAWEETKKSQPDIGLDAFASTIVSVLPVDDTAQLPDPTLPAPGAGS